MGDGAIENLQTEAEKTRGKAKWVVRDVWDGATGPTVMFLQFQRKRREIGMQDIFQEKIDKNKPKLMTDSRCSVNLKQHKYTEIHNLGISCLDCWRKKMFYKQLEKNVLDLEEHQYEL